PGVDVQDHHRGGVATGVVAHPDDLAVADRPQHPVEVAHLRGPQVDPFHGALGVLQIDPVPDGDDVLEEHHDAGHEVLDDRPGPDAGGPTDHAQGGAHGSDVHA